MKGPLGGEHILFSSFLHLFCHDGVPEGQMKASLARDCNRTLYKYLPFKGHFKAMQRPVVMLIFMIFFTVAEFDCFFYIFIPCLPPAAG